MTRPGDIPIEERVNAGISELSEFFPTSNGERDAFSALTETPYRAWIYLGKTKRTPHVSTRRDHRYIQPVELPEYVITQVIELEGYTWNYKTSNETAEDRRRVFTIKDQLLTLDLDETLSWLNAAKDTPRYEEVRKQLEEENAMDNTNNKIILQLMYGRYEDEKPLLPNLSKKINKPTKKESR